MPAKFPRRDADGFFAIEVLIDGVGPESIAAIQSWIEGTWMPRNNSWTQISRTGAELAVVKEETLNYFDEFVSSPRIGVSGSSLAIKFSGKPLAKWWKDWLVRFLSELKTQFPSVEVTKISDCEA